MRSFLVTDEVRDYAVGHGSWRPDEVVDRLCAADRRVVVLPAFDGLTIARKLDRSGPAAQENRAL